MPPAGAPLVAIMNTNDDIVMMLRILLESEGIATAVTHVRHIKDGRVDLVAFLEEFNPAAIIYDIPPPYDEQWNFLNLVRTNRAAAGRPFILTTTNKRALESLVGPKPDVHEIIGKPFDLDAVVRSVKRAVGLPEETAATDPSAKGHVGVAGGTGTNRPGGVVGSNE
jgi:DNA-binding NtrC family response regulator